MILVILSLKFTMAKKKTVITIEPNKYYTIPVVAKFLGYSDRSGVSYLVKT
jgi:hypothetical protein